MHIPISEIFVHPEYSRSMSYHNIAIIKLKERVSVSENLKPLCLQVDPIKPEDLLETSLVSLGWGIIENLKSDHDFLQKPMQ